MVKRVVWECVDQLLQTACRLTRPAKSTYLTKQATTFFEYTMDSSPVACGIPSETPLEIPETPIREIPETPNIWETSIELPEVAKSLASRWNCQHFANMNAFFRLMRNLEAPRELTIPRTYEQ